MGKTFMPCECNLLDPQVPTSDPRLGGMQAWMNFGNKCRVKHSGFGTPFCKLRVLPCTYKYWTTEFLMPRPRLLHAFFDTRDFQSIHLKFHLITRLSKNYRWYIFSELACEKRGFIQVLVQYIYGTSRTVIGIECGSPKYFVYFRQQRNVY